MGKPIQKTDNHVKGAQNRGGRKGSSPGTPGREHPVAQEYSTIIQPLLRESIRNNNKDPTESELGMLYHYTKLENWTM